MVLNLALIAFMRGVIFALLLFCKTELLKFKIFDGMGQSQMLIMMQGRISEISGRTSFSLNTGVGNQNLCGPESGSENLYALNNLNTRVGGQN